MNSLTQFRTRCRSCRRPILWAVTSRGNRQPVDAQPTTDGNLILTPDGNLLRADVATTEQRDAGDELHLPHHATCPDAATFRRKTP